MQNLEHVAGADQGQTRGCQLGGGVFVLKVAPDVVGTRPPRHSGRVSSPTR